MKLIQLTIFLLLVQLVINAQPIDMSNRDTVFKYYHVNFAPYMIDSFRKSRQIGEEPDMFRKVLNQQFGSLITGQSKNLLGNFASVDITNPAVAFAANAISKNGSVFSMKASGGISDGLYSIFNNSSLNTDVSLDLQYNFMDLSKQVLMYNADTGRSYKLKVSRIKYDWEEAFITLFNKREEAELRQKEAKLRLAIDSMQKIVDSLKKAGGNNDAIAELSYNIEIKRHMRDSVTQAVGNYTSYKTLFRNLQEKTVLQLEALSFTPAVMGFSFGWVSIGYKVSNSKFKLFNPASAPASQVADTSFVSHTATFQYSHYSWSPESFKSFFFDAGLSFTYSDNFSSLAKNEITETKNYGASPGERTTTSKYNAYTGNYSKDLKGVKIFADAYWFMFKNNMAALHFNPEWVTASGEKPLANAYTGFLFSFKSSKTDNAIVNAELYYKFLDIFKTSKATYKLFERNDIGIRFTFPIQFK
jgi:hypothetical protein